MKRLINIFLLLTFQIGYLHWGKDNSSFIFTSEAALLSKLNTHPEALLHPLILIPLCGQLLLLYTIFQKVPNRILTYIGLACLSILMLFLFFIGIITPSIRIAGSAIPFILSGIAAIWYHRKPRVNQ